MSKRRRDTESKAGSDRDTESKLKRGRTEEEATALVVPRRSATGVLHFASHPTFLPNVTPEEVLRKGAFGGGYFRPIYSSIAKAALKDAWKELPHSWIDGLSVKDALASPVYHVTANCYGAKCGQSLEVREIKGGRRSSKAKSRRASGIRLPPERKGVAWQQQTPYTLFSFSAYYAYRSGKRRAGSWHRTR